MLYYTVLFLIAVLVSIIVISMYRTIISVAKATQSAILPGYTKASSKARLNTRREMGRKGNTTITNNSEIPTPWGWKASTHSGNAVHKPGSDKVLWTGPAPKRQGVGEGYIGYSNAEPSEVSYAGSAKNTRRQHADWPYRQDKVAFAGKAYKVKRKAIDGNELGADDWPWVW